MDSWCLTRMGTSQHSAESHVFSLGTLVSSHGEIWQGVLGYMGPQFLAYAVMTLPLW